MSNAIVLRLAICDLRRSVARLVEGGPSRGRRRRVKHWMRSDVENDSMPSNLWPRSRKCGKGTRGFRLMQTMAVLMSQCVNFKDTDPYLPKSMCNQARAPRLLPRFFLSAPINTQLRWIGAKCRRWRPAARARSNFPWLNRGQWNYSYYLVIPVETYSGYGNTVKIEECAPPTSATAKN